MRIVLDTGTKERIRNYHRYHGDRSIKIIKVIQDSNGYDAVVVRVVNSNGEKYSCIDLMDLEGDIAELTSVKTEYEADMIKSFEDD
jgi:hypothetical protein